VAFLTRSLAVGGAERQLTLLARGLAGRGHRVLVAAMYGGGALEAELAGSTVELAVLEKRSRWDAGFLARLAGRVGAWRPQALYSFLDVPNLLAAGLKPAWRGARVVWGVRDALGDFSGYDWFARAANRLTYPVSRWADAVVANSRAAARHHAARGLGARELAVIPNGIDTGRFRFDPAGRRRMRAAWGVGPGEVLVGMAARLDPKKDHPNLLEAFGRLRRERPGLRLVCIGGGPAGLARRLQGRAAELGLAGAVVWAGEVADMPAAYSALDLKVLSSYGESFPNCLAEAMACGRPVAATRAGDSAWVVGREELLAPPRDPAALAAACARALAGPPERREELGRGLRRRVEERFAPAVLVARTEELLARVIGGAA
jgi:glycosyltransferase involved in cell wall biosynthesis